MKDLNTYKEISNYLNDEISYESTEFIEKAITNKKFLLTFIGQFSAGKSKLINNILDKNLLPVHITETTQIATLIKYGEDERAIVYSNDNATEEISIEDVKKIWEGNTKESIINKDNIKYIEVSINSSVLKSGLLIADTPGINTIIKKHEMITRNILRSSEGIVYVMPKAITEVDKIFMNEVSKLGLKLLCVRTYMDSIKETEENIYDTIKKDKEIIKEIDGNIIDIYHVSNERDNKWYENIEKIRNYISNDLAKDIDKSLEESCSLRLNKIRETLLLELENNKENLNKILDGNEKDLIKENKELESLIEKLQVKLKDKKLNYNKEIREVKSGAKKEILELKACLKRNFKRKIEENSYSDGVNKEILNIVYEELSDSRRRLTNSYINEFNLFIEENYNELLNQLKDCNGVLNNNIKELLPSSIEEVALTVDEENNEVEAIQRKLLEVSRNIEEMEKKISECSSNSEEYEKQYKELCEIAKNIENELASQGVYEQRLIETENEETQPSEILKIIGSAADLATFFIPSSVYTKIAGKIGKYSAAASKVVKNIGKADSVKDSIFAVKSILDKTRQTKKRTAKVIDTVNNIKSTADEVGILDFLTFEHWFAQAGKIFDKPKKIEIDREYEREFNEEREFLNKQYSQAKAEEINKLQSLGLIKSEEEKVNRMRENEKRKLIILERELKEKEGEIRIKSRNRAFNNFKNQYISIFETSINHISEKVIEKCDEYLEIPLKQYFEKCTSNINYEINKHLNTNKELMNTYNNSEINKIKEEHSKCLKYVEFLEGDNYGELQVL